MDTLTGTLHHPERVGRDDPVAMLRKRLGNAAALLGRWQARAAQRRRLLELDDRLLADIGVSLAEAQAVGRRPFWRA